MVEGLIFQRIMFEKLNIMELELQLNLLLLVCFGIPLFVLFPHNLIAPTPAGYDDVYRDYSVGISAAFGAVTGNIF